MVETFDHEIKHDLNEEEFSLTTTGVTKSGKEMRLYVKWSTEEKMSRKLATTLEITENLIKNHDEENGEPYTQGVSNIRKHRLAFGITAVVFTASGQNYDEASLVIGPIKLILNISPQGKYLFRTLRVVLKNEYKSFHIGWGGRTSARAVHLERTKD